MKENLRALEICHYVFGAIIVLLGFIPLLYAALGGLFMSNFFHQVADPDFPPIVGAIMIGFGVVIFCVIETLGILNIVSGRMISNRKGRVFTMVIAGFNCFVGNMLGIALGVFTFVLMSKEEVQEAYKANREILTDRVS